MSVKLSVIIPSFKDPLLNKTILSVLENSTVDIEVIPVLDGYSDDLTTDSRVNVIEFSRNRGMRPAINAGLAIATGEFIMKCDSHCLFAPGYDSTLIESCADNRLVIPRRYILDDDNWSVRRNRPHYDYHYYTFPVDGKYGCGIFVVPWKIEDRDDVLIDDTMAFQGSCWLANRKYFMEHVGFLDYRRETYGTFAGEHTETGLKYWLGGGEVKINKNTWYAHLQKAKHHYLEGIYHKTYKNNKHAVNGYTWYGKHWMSNEEPNMIHKLSWLIEKFWPVPTWPDNYKDLC